ncbi:hypothetical protein D9M73_120550 [compost metagenome]
MFFVQDQKILRAQELRQNARRAGVEMRLGPDIHRLHGGAIIVQHGVRVGKGAQHALQGFAGAPGIRAAKIIQTAAGMGVDQRQRARFLLQGPHQRDQQAVLHDVGAVAGMEGMAIIHGESKSRRSAFYPTCRAQWPSARRWKAPIGCAYKVARKPSTPFCAGTSNPPVDRAAASGYPARHCARPDAGKGDRALCLASS